MSRELSSIYVQVLDLSETSQQALDILKSSDEIMDSVQELVPDEPWGLVNVSDNLFVVRFDGFVSVLDDMSPLQLEYYVKFINGGFLPDSVMTIDIDIETVLEIPIKEKVSLDRFIINFTEVSQENYRNLLELFEEPDTTEYLNKTQLKKYMPFIQSTWCECNEKTERLLFGAKPYSCICGVKRQHVHCKSCGGIFRIGKKES